MIQSNPISVPMQAPVLGPSLKIDQGSLAASSTEARIQDLMLQLRADSLQSQELAHRTSSRLRLDQVQLMQQMASSTRWDGVRSLAFGLIGGVTACASPFVRPSLQQPLQAFSSNVLPQVARCWDSFSESARMPQQLERTHLDHRVQGNSAWLQHLQSQEQRIQEIYRSCLIQVRA
jgi:hypothetical protein